MTGIVFEPIATAIAMARSLVPSVEELHDVSGGDPFAINAVVPAILIHIFAKEIEGAYAEIARLEAMVMLTGEPGGTA